MSVRKGTLLAIMATAAAVVLPLGVAPFWLRIVLAVPFLLVLPGFATAAALLPRERPLGAERLLLALALSLAIAVLEALVLNLTPGGLADTSWAVLLWVVTTGCSLIAMGRGRSRRARGRGDQLDRLLAVAEELVRYLGEAEGAESLPAQLERARFNLAQHELRSMDPFRPRLRLRGAVPAALALALAGAAIGLARTPLHAHGVKGYTSLWIVPAAEHSAKALQVGVSSSELHHRSYRLAVRVGTIRLLDQRLELSPRQTWRRTVRLPASMGRLHPVEALLYSGGAATELYRRVDLAPTRVG